jgi:UTP:GlnB (protein PII) uridylyltransferase
MSSDAYLVLTYRCDVCGKTETVWNAREGSAPSFIPCTKNNCHNVMGRSERHRERKRKNFPLVRGALYFSDITEAEAQRQAGARCSQLLSEGKLSADKYDARFESIVASFFRNGPAPQLTTKC